MKKETFYIGLFLVVLMIIITAYLLSRRFNSLDLKMTLLAEATSKLATVEATIHFTAINGNGNVVGNNNSTCNLG